MDSLSQFALGAAIGEATLGRSLGRKALIVGGLLGTPSGNSRIDNQHSVFVLNLTIAEACQIGRHGIVG